MLVAVGQIHIGYRWAHMVTGHPFLGRDKGFGRCRCIVYIGNLDRDRLWLRGATMAVLCAVAKTQRAVPVLCRRDGDVGPSKAERALCWVERADDLKGV
jgi:hypothetical protein